MIETEITSKLVHALRKQVKAEVLNLHGHGMQAPGWPDLHISHPKWSGWLECKGAFTQIKPLQRKIVTNLTNNGELAYFLTFAQDNEWGIDRCDDTILCQFSFPKCRWSVAAEMLMEKLHGLGNNARVPPAL